MTAELKVRVGVMLMHRAAPAAHTYALPPCTLACIVSAQVTHLVTVLSIQEHGQFGQKSSFFRAQSRPQHVYSGEEWGDPVLDPSPDQTPDTRRTLIFSSLLEESSDAIL
jgi:hypothetical protein